MEGREMTKLVCSDRDGTINLDENYYLGSSENWREQVVFLESVVDGIKLFNSTPNLNFFIITNQSGVALELFTPERMDEVNKYMIERLKKQGASVNGYFSCPFIDSAYARKAGEKGRKVNPNYIVDNHPDLKPNIGMIEKAAESLGLRLEQCDVYTIGDRVSDVELGLKAGGTGILVAGFKTKELGDVDRIEKLAEKNPNKVYIAKNFLDVARYITNEVKV